MQVGHVAHIDDTKADVGAGRQAAVEQLLHDHHRSRVVAAPYRPQHHAGVDAAELHRATFGATLFCHPRTRSAFGNGLGTDVGRGAGVVVGRPVGLGEVVHTAPAAIGHGGHAGRHDEPLHARGLGGAQHAQRAIARGHDQFVGMFGHPGRQRRGQVQHMAATGYGRGPASVGRQIGGKETQPGVVHLQHGAHLIFTRQAAHRGVHLPARSDQLTNDIAGDVAAAASDEHGARAADRRHGVHPAAALLPSRVFQRRARLARDSPLSAETPTGATRTFKGSRLSAPAGRQDPTTVAVARALARHLIEQLMPVSVAVQTRGEMLCRARPVSSGPNRPG